MITDETKQINGFFEIEVQKISRKIRWFFGLLVGILLSFIGIGGIVNIITGEAESVSGGEIVFGVIALIAGPLLVIAALVILFRKTGVYFRGLRTTDLGFEAGSMVVGHDAIEPKNWQKSYTGKIRSVNWQADKPIMGDQLTIIIFIKESRYNKDQYFFNRLVVVSNQQVVFELIGSTGHNENLCNNLVTISNGEFQLLGEANSIAADYHKLIDPLENIEEALRHTGKTPDVILNILSKTVDMIPFLAGGAIGVLVGSRIDASRRKGMIRKLQDGQKFDKQFTDDLVSFADKAGWAITVEGEEVELK